MTRACDGRRLTLELLPSVCDELAERARDEQASIDEMVERALRAFLEREMYGALLLHGGDNGLD